MTEFSTFKQMINCGLLILLIGVTVLFSDNVLTRSQIDYLLDVDFPTFSILLVAFIGFYSAKYICRTTAFYYSSAGFLGFIGSFVILIFILSRFIPKVPNRFKFAFFVFGPSSMVLLRHVDRLFWSRMGAFLKDFSPYVIIYITLATILCLGYAYQRGPIKDYRTLNLVQWSFQSLCLLVIFLAIPHYPISLTLVAIILFHYNFGSFISKILLFLFFIKYLKRKPKLQPRQLLTDEEYVKEGQIYTQRELEKLRQFCRSPDIDKWSLVYRLKAPKRFTQFILDGHDITEEEQTIYDSSCSDFFDNSESAKELSTPCNLNGNNITQEENEINYCGQKILIPEL